MSLGAKGVKVLLAVFQILTESIIEMTESIFHCFYVVLFLEYCVTVSKSGQSCGRTYHWTSGDFCVLQDTVKLALWVLRAIV